MRKHVSTSLPNASSSSSYSSLLLQFSSANSWFAACQTYANSHYLGSTKYNGTSMCMNVYLDKWPQNRNLFFDTFKFRQSFWTFQFLVSVWRALSTHGIAALESPSMSSEYVYIKQEIRCFYGIDSSDTGAQIFFSRSWFNFIVYGLRVPCCAFSFLRTCQSNYANLTFSPVEE